MKFIPLVLILLSSSLFAGEKLCTSPFKVQYINSKKVACVAEVTLPDFGNPRHYCHYISDGYIGYSFDDVEGKKYVCPQGFRQAPNGKGHTYCAVDDIKAPANAKVKATCDNFLEYGVLSYEVEL